MSFNEVVGRVTRSAFQLLLLWLAALLAVTVALAYLVTRGVTKPIATMTGAVRKVSGGDFSVRIEQPTEPEFWELTNAFNQMGGEIERLIDENYVIHLKETQAQLMALNLQLHPHFLYNTLNIMNLIALENDQDELSQMIAALSQMLQYALKHEEGLSRLEDELRWLDNYLTIMNVRFEGMFRMTYDVAEEARAFGVPKLILQPIVENCFAHGHIGARPGGHIHLSARLVGDAVHIAVEDNGDGMDVVRVLREMRMPNPQHHIGLSNAYQRMQLNYGRQADIRLASLTPSGSRVTLVIPHHARTRLGDLSNNDGII